MHKPRHTGVWLSLIAGAAALAVALAVLSRRTALLAAKAERAAELETENRTLRARADALSREIDSLRARLSGMAAAEAPRESGLPSAGYPPGAVEAVRMLGQLKDSLAAANRTIEQLRAQTAELEAAVDKLREENRRLAAQDVDLRDTLAGQTRLVEALQAEVKGKNDRLGPLELNNRALRKQNEELAAKIAAVSKLTAELEDINRRRDAYLHAILRRYREVTDQYRALAARLEDPDSRTGAGATDLSRIMNTVSLAEEDLRQLQSLNAQAQSLQRKIKAN